MRYIIVLLLAFISGTSHAAGKIPSEKAVEQPIYGLCKFIRSSDAGNLKYLVEAYNPTEQIQGMTDETKILAALSNVEKAATHLSSVPEGVRTIYIGGSVIYDLYESGKRLPTQFDMIGKYESPWMDKWEAVVKKRLETFTDALAAKGVRVDYVMLDYEEKGPANYEINKQDAGVWSAIMADSRWGALR